MNRRRFLGAAAPALLAGPGAAGPGRPNIVLIEPDSWDGRALGYLGHPAMRGATPNLDRLAARGTAFRNAYCSHPVCCPSRANMWSGRYTHNVGSWNNHKGLSETDRTFKHYLEAAGYHFASQEGGFGKHDYLSGGHTIFNRVVEWTAPADIRLPQFRMGPPVVARDDSDSPRNDWTRVAEARSFLRQTGKPGAPFFLYVGLSMPHPPFVTKPKWLSMVDRKAVTIPPQDEEVHPVMAYQRISKDWRHGFSPDAVRNTRAIYYAMCAETDAMIGSIVDEVERLGLAGNTYIIVISDHGENNMEHRQYYKMNMYESSARVPLVISGPGIRRGRVLDNYCFADRSVPYPAGDGRPEAAGGDRRRVADASGDRQERPQPQLGLRHVQRQFGEHLHVHDARRRLEVHRLPGIRAATFQPARGSRRDSQFRLPPAGCGARDGPEAARGGRLR
jgi:arylsulfatase K